MIQEAESIHTLYVAPLTFFYPMPNDQNENLRQKMVVSFETIVFELTSMTPPTQREQGVVHKLR